MSRPMNTRILVVDDEEVVRDSVREILCPTVKDRRALEEAARDLFDDEDVPAPSPKTKVMTFRVDEAASGASALEKATQALEAADPYALVFLDMRMPGWDGLETAERLRVVDPRAELMFVTAQSQHAIQEVVERAGPHVGYLCKPFVPEEIHQLATKSVCDWNRLRSLEHLITVMSELRGQPGHLDALLENVFVQATDWLGLESAALVRWEQGGGQVERARGVFTAPSEIDRAMASLDPGTIEGARRVGEFLVFPLDGERALIAIDARGELGTERGYLLQLYLEHSGRALENARLAEALLQREKLSALGQALSGLIHDLRSPVAAIQNVAELLRDDPGDQDMVREMSDLIDHSAEEALALVNDVLDFVRDGTPTLVPTTLAEVLGPRADLRRPGAAPVVLEGDLDAELHLDPRKFGRVVQNLVNNAQEALRDAKTPDPRVVIEARAGSGEVVLTIRDNGPGVPEKIRDRLFEAFVTEGKADGTGLGLAIVEQAVRAHGGRIRYVDGGPGACFEITLPRSGSAPQPEPRASGASFPAL